MAQQNSSKGVILTCIALIAGLGFALGYQMLLTKKNKPGWERQAYKHALTDSTKAIFDRGKQYGRAELLAEQKRAADSIAQAQHEAARKARIAAQNKKKTKPIQNWHIYSLGTLGEPILEE